MTKKVPKSMDFGTFLHFCRSLESEEKVVHNATITAVKKGRNRGFEKATFYNFLRERTASMKSFKSVCVTGGSDSAMRWSESTILFFWRAFLYAHRIFGLWHHGKGEMMGGALERIPQVGVKQGLLPWQRRLSKQYAWKSLSCSAAVTEMPSAFINFWISRLVNLAIHLRISSAVILHPLL